MEPWRHEKKDWHLEKAYPQMYHLDIVEEVSNKCVLFVFSLHTIFYDIWGITVYCTFANNPLLYSLVLLPHVIVLALLKY